MCYLRKVSLFAHDVMCPSIVKILRHEVTQVENAGHQGMGGGGGGQITALSDDQNLTDKNDRDKVLKEMIPEPVKYMVSH